MRSEWNARTIARNAYIIRRRKNRIGGVDSAGKRRGFFFSIIYTYTISVAHSTKTTGGGGGLFLGRLATRQPNRTQDVGAARRIN